MKAVVEPWEKLEAESKDLLELFEMSGDDAGMIEEICKQASSMGERLGDLEIRTKMSDAEDPLPCYLYIHPGAGGTESCDWAGMLLRMYTRWCERRGMEVQLVELLEGEEAGIRRVKCAQDDAPRLRSSNIRRRIRQ